MRLGYPITCVNETNILGELYSHLLLGETITTHSEKLVTDHLLSPNHPQPSCSAYSPAAIRLSYSITVVLYAKETNILGELYSHLYTAVTIGNS